MNKRYQVFVSSTYLDLKRERAEVMRTLLEMKQFPAGMELFPAASSRPQEFIKEVIDDCDYYILIVGGRNGSEIDGGQSYTKWEYRYAKQQGLPILTFLREDPHYIPVECEKEPAESKRKLLEFRKELECLQCKKWTTPDGLAKDLAIALWEQIDKTPKVGWVRADHVAHRELERDRAIVPQGIEVADEIFEVQIEVTVYSSDEFGLNGGQEVLPITDTVSAKEAFGRLAPSLVPSGDEHVMKNALDSLFRERLRSGKIALTDEQEVTHVRLSDNDFNRIWIKLRDFGWIELDEKSLVKGASPVWKLTGMGDEIMSQLI